MQKTKLLMLATMIVAMAMTDSLHLEARGDQSLISLQKKTDHLSSPSAPRVPSATRIEAFYDSELLSVCVFFTNAGNEVNVDIDNLDTGESVNYSVSGSGSTALPISGAAGLWIITLTLSNGDQYEGEFEV